MEAMELISLHSDRCRFCLVIMPVLQLALVLALAHTSWAQVPVCGQDDFTYELTECDESGGRWRVAVPKLGKCHGGTPPAPVRWKNCDFQCDSGRFLDVRSTQECQPCPSGTFSLGGGIRYDSFSVLPRGFQVSTQESFDVVFSDDRGNSADDFQASVNCSEFGWQISQNLLAFIPNRCLSTLAFSAKVVTAGTLRFSYFYADEEISFRFSIQSQQCVSVDAKSKSSPFLRPTSEGKWVTKTVIVTNIGQYVFSWRASAISDRRQPVLIRFIEITGIGYTDVCTLCPNGTYSSGGSLSCTACEPNTYSGQGASKCFDCGETHYSGYRSADCKIRPPCLDSDYYEFRHPCDDRRKTKIEYRWIEPKICSETAPGAVRGLPATRENLECPPCNPGQHLVSGNCSFCAANFYSDGIGACQKCPVGTAPNRGYQFISWNSLPPNMAVECEEGDEVVGSACRDLGERAVWQPAGDQIRTIRTGHSDVLFLLSLRVPQGFANSFLSGVVSESNPVAQIIFELELNCASSCELYFVERPSGSDSSPVLLNIWNGTIKRSFYRHPIVSYRPTTFQWAFMRGRLAKIEDRQQSSANDFAAIRLINVTNTVDGGASACLPCPLDSAGTNCVSCPPGHFLDTLSHECHRCPAGHYLNATSATAGLSACLPCGPNLEAIDGVECRPDCHQLNVSGRRFDLSGLIGSHQVRGVSLFGRDGTNYYHIFNLSLCGSNRVHCHDNLSSVFEVEAGRNVSGLLCRATGIPQSHGPVYGSTAAIADHLLAVTNETRWEFLSVNDQLLREKNGREANDLHFYYGSSAPTAKCQAGQGAVVTLRCDPTKSPSDPPEFHLPSKCPDATCDGCTFHFLVRTKIACPICGTEDYQTIVGECRDGHQTITRVPSRHCVWAGNDRQHESVVECSSFSTTVQMVIGAATGLAVLLCLLLVFVWKKNQRLEYKYSKLIESQGDKELPTAESCGLNEDDTEETDDRVTFARGKKFFGRLKADSYGRGNKDGSIAESSRIMTDIS